MWVVNNKKMNCQQKIWVEVIFQLMPGLHNMKGINWLLNMCFNVKQIPIEFYKRKENDDEFLAIKLIDFICLNK